MLALRARTDDVHLMRPLRRSVWVLATGNNPLTPREAQAFLATDGSAPPPGYALYVSRSDVSEPMPGNHIHLPAQLDYLGEGDVLSIARDGRRLHVLWRASSEQNSVLLTERCNHYCLMCSQPPKAAKDDWLMNDAFELVRLLPRSTRNIGFTGGEPTLHGEWLLELLMLCRNLLPRADVHILTNGKRFADLRYAASYAAISNPKMMLGIPIYGSEPSLHDYVVQSAGAFDETVRGILNLARLEQRIEIRVVVHKQTAPALVDIAEYISRNLPFVEQVALMGLEMIGFARANIDDVWIDPFDYQEQLAEATLLLDRSRIRVMVYNHQLCLVDRRVWPFAVKSISDWKNEYHPECLSCDLRSECGGFFFSAKYRRSDHIRAVRESRLTPALLELAD